MDKKKFYKSASLVAALIGVGMLLGHSLASGTSNNGLWVGFMLLFAAAVSFGMSLGSPKDRAQKVDGGE